MENKIISVIVPVYNVEKYLSECIESIIDQTYLDLEIILINDGSTDGSFDICKEYEKRDSRIKLIDKINGGLSSARNAGIDNASGAYLCFVDSDDCLEKDALMQLYQAISESDISICSMSSDKNALTQGVSPPSSILTAAEAIKLILQEKRMSKLFWL